MDNVQHEGPTHLHTQTATGASIGSSLGSAVNVTHEAVTFDDLSDPIYSPKKTGSKKGGKNEKESSKEIQKASEEVTSFDSMEHTSSVDEDTKAKKSPKDEKSDESKSTEQLEKDIKKAIKAIKLKAGETDIEVPVDAKILKKIDGKEVEVTLEEALNQYAGKVAWEKRFNQLDKERKTFQTERSQIESVINKFVDLSKGTDPLKAVDFLVEINGGDPVSFRKQLRSQMAPQLKEFLELTPEQQKLKETEEENGYYKRLHEERVKEQTFTKKQQEFQSKVEKMLEESGLDQDTFVETYKELAPLYKQVAGKDLEQEEPHKAVENVIKYRKEVELESSMTELVKNVNKELDGDKLFKAVDVMKQVYRSNPEATIQDLTDVAKEAFGSKAVQNLQKKIVDSEAKPTSKQKHINTRTDPISFDDLDF